VTNEIFLRFGIVLVLAALGVGVYVAINRWLLKRRQDKRFGLESFKTGRPGVLYFTMEGCLPCKTTQRPALRLLSEMTNRQVQVIEVDVQERPDLASHWGVLSVPTTFIIDPQGRPRRVNHGVAREGKLRQQIEETSGATWFQAEVNTQASEPVTAPGLD
jgi:thiol-disulfide isomerase/thioredoxin